MFKFLRQNLNAAPRWKRNFRRMERKQDEGKREDFVIDYVSDVEGNLEYFRRYVGLSRNLVVDGEKGTLRWRNESLPSMFVFGGDVFDKGPGDIAFAKMLVQFKVSYPERVFLLIGNRDMNKIKLTSELAEGDLALRVEDVPKPYWFPPAQQVSYKTFLASEVIPNDPTIPPPLQDYPAETYASFNTRANRLKWMLKHTMGSPECFEYRRQELLSMCSKSFVSDEEVVDSFYKSLEEGGFVREYLLNAQMMLVVGNTLFVHGAVSAESMGFVPDFSNKDAIQAPEERTGIYTSETHSVQEWTMLLNDWTQEGIGSWIKRPYWNSERNERGGSFLMSYCYEPAMGGKTVMITSFFEKNGNPGVLDEKVSQYLLKSGISRVVVGHKPFGDTPTVLKGDVEIVSADQSFSDTTAKDNRGLAVSAVIIEGTKDCNKVILKGYNKNGTYFEFDLPTRDNTRSYPSSGNTLIGERLNDNFIVKAKLVNGQYLLSRGQGRQVEYKEMEERNLIKELNKLDV